MGKPTRLVLALALVAAACGSANELADDEGSTTTSTSIVSTTTTMLAETTTTTGAAPVGPLTLDGPGALEPGAIYTADFFVPLEITVDQAGWVARFVFEEAVSLSFGDSALIFLAITPDGEREEILGAVLSDSETISVVRQPVMGTLGARSISTADVVIPEHPMFGCGGPAVWRLGRGGAPGKTLKTVGVVDFGIVRCRTTRVWAIDVGSQVVTVLGVASDDARFEEFMPIFEDFLENRVTFGDADG